MSDPHQTPQAPPVPPMPSPPASDSAPTRSASATAREPSGAKAGEQTLEEYLASFPPVVYVPTTDETDPTHRRVILHTLEDGRTALFVYSAPDRLNDFYLRDNPWVLCDGAALQKLKAATPFELLLLDMDPGLRAEEG